MQFKLNASYENSSPLSLSLLRHNMVQPTFVRIEGVGHTNAAVIARRPHEANDFDVSVEQLLPRRVDLVHVCEATRATGQSNVARTGHAPRMIHHTQRPVPQSQTWAARAVYFSPIACSRVYSFR